MPIPQGTRLLGAQNLVSYPDLVIVAAASAVQILAANPNQITAFVYNNGSNPARIGDANVGATQGIPLIVGGGLTFEATGPLYAYSVSGTTISILATVRP